MENNTDESLADKASTSERDLNKTASSGKNVGDVKSLAVLLGQGLTSGDSEKIDSVLSNGDVQTISATLNDLPITQIVPLLKQIEHRLKNRNVHDIRIWVRWLQYIVSTHMAYLSTLETLEDDLKDLFDWMRNRTSQMGKLCSLYGKLSLITEQIERRVNPHLFILQEPVALFEEDNLSLSESSEELDDLEDESIESDDDWWDDEEIASGSDQDVSGKFT
uniref:Utp12 domain-containing protein n=1 Tax=Syphacia muris TaxID=451379 RepID=A0A0N5AS13_9BILA